MTAQPARSERSGPEASSAMDVSPFRSALVKAVFRDVTSMHVTRAAVEVAASVTRTVLAEIIDGARGAAAEEARKKLSPEDLVSAIDRNVELEVGTKWYDHSPTFQGLTGVVRDAEGVIVLPPERSRSRKPSAVAGAHRFEAGVRKLLRSRGTTAVPAMIRDLDGIASVFLTDLARDAAMIVREGGARRFGTVTLVSSDEPAQPPFLKDAGRAPSRRRENRRTIGRGDVLAATAMQLSGGYLRQRALTEAREASPITRNSGAPRATPLIGRGPEGRPVSLSS